MAASQPVPGPPRPGAAVAQDGERLGTGHALDKRPQYTYHVGMPQLTIYVDRELAEQIREHGVQVSKVCQAALRRKVRLAERGAKVVRSAKTGEIIGYTTGDASEPTAP